MSKIAIPEHLRTIGDDGRDIAPFTVEETGESREGSRRSSRGSSDPRTFRVTFEVPQGGYTRESYPDPRAAVAVVIPPGSYHPWNAWLQADDYIVLRRLSGTNTWEVQVIYVSPVTVPGLIGILDGSVRGTGNRWSIGVQSASVSIPQWETLPDEQGKTKLIGPPVYNRTTAATEFYANLTEVDKVSGEVTSVKQHLKLAEDDLRQRVPVNKEWPALAVTISVFQDAFALNRVARVAEYIKRVNNVTFRFGPFDIHADAGRVKLDNFTLSEEAPRSATTAGRLLPVGMKIVRINFVFLISSIPFDPLKLTHIIRDEHGHEAPVRRTDGSIVNEDFHNIERVDFNALIAMFT